MVKVIRISDELYNKIVDTKLQFWRKRGKRMTFSDLIEVKKVD